MLSENLVESFRVRLDALGLELADLRIGGTQARPLVQVRIEWPPGEPPRRVTVDDCDGEPSAGDLARRRRAAGAALRTRGVEPGARSAAAVAPPLGAVRRSRGAGDGRRPRPRARPDRRSPGRGDGGPPAGGRGAAARAADRNPRRTFGGRLVADGP